MMLKAMLNVMLKVMLRVIDVLGGCFCSHMLSSACGCGRLILNVREGEGGVESDEGREGDEAVNVMNPHCWL